MSSWTHVLLSLFIFTPLLSFLWYLNIIEDSEILHILDRYLQLPSQKPLGVSLLSKQPLNLVWVSRPFIICPRPFFILTFPFSPVRPASSKQTGLRAPFENTVCSSPCAPTTLQFLHGVLSLHFPTWLNYPLRFIATTIFSRNHMSLLLKSYCTSALYQLELNSILRGKIPKITVASFSDIWKKSADEQPTVGRATT